MKNVLIHFTRNGKLKALALVLAVVTYYSMREKIKASDSPLAYADAPQAAANDKAKK